MSLLFCNALLIVVAIVWIAMDVKTVSIFDVFGKNFRWVWFESGQRWTHLSTYGWRLILLCSFVLVGCFLSFRVYAANPLRVSTAAQSVVFAALLASSLAPFPWIYLAPQIRLRRQIRATAHRLDEFAKGAVANLGPSRTLDPAPYHTDELWTAWHPRLDEWKSNRMWDGIVPVVYLRQIPCPAALFSVDWETFLAWNIPTEDIRVDSELPVRGALNSSFRVLTAQALNGCPKWSVVHAQCFRN